jgi:group I intron endonuclease
MTCGIYKITNKQNEKFYIGSSIDIEHRWYTHRLALQKGTHGNKYLQRSWDKYGEDSFIFSILVETSEDSLLDKEQEILDETKCYDKNTGYNIALSARAPMRGRSHQKEVRNKISEALKGRILTSEHKRKISEANKGKKRSAEWREKVSEALKGRILNSETRRKMSEAKRKPRTLTSEHKRKISEFAKTRTGHKAPNSRLTPEQIDSMRKDFEESDLTNRKIAEKYGVSLSTVGRIKQKKSNY